MNVTSQAFSDPKLGGPELALLLPILVAFFALGRIMRSWTAAITVLHALRPSCRAHVRRPPG